MAIINVKCKHCDNNMSFDTASKKVTCEFCGSTYNLSELLDEKDISFLEKLKPNEIESKIEATAHIKNGEALIYQADFVKAEAEFKKAIELDKTNHHAYFGVVKAKTHNLTIIPNFDGYLSFAKDALKYAQEDDKEHIRAEINKLKLLEKEKETQKKYRQKKQAAEFKKETKKRKRLDLFSKILYILIFVLTGFALVAVIAKSYTDDLKNNQKNATIEISTASDLLNFMTKKEYLSATLVLKNDIDLSGATWSPIGNATSPFSGKFYGNNHTISNLKIQSTNTLGENYYGLFGYVKGATIMGIKLNNCNIVETSTAQNYEQNNNATNIGHANFATNYAGFIVARADNSTIKLCEISNNSSISITNKIDGNLIFGGIAGLAKNSEINHCVVHAKITAEAKDAQLVSTSDSLNFAIGGIVGKINNSGISYSYSTSQLDLTVFAQNNHDIINLFAGGIVGFANNESDKNFYVRYCYFVGSINATAVAGSENQNISLGAIISSTSTTNNISSNLTLQNDQNYVSNGLTLLFNDLYDFDLTTFAETDQQLTDFISKNFSNQIWNNTNTTTPSLKSN